MSDFQRKKIRPWDDLDSLLPKSNQLVTNKESQSNLLVTQEVTNKEPISNQLVTNKKSEFSGKVTNKEPISNPTGNRNKEPISNQLVLQLVTNSEAKTAVKRLCGIQKKILFFIVEQCVDEGHLISGPVTNETLRYLADTDAHTIKTAVQRLIQKGLLQRSEGKRGKGGFASFSINKDIRHAVIEQKKQEGISNQLVTLQVTDNSNQLVTNKVPNREPTVSSSSSDLNINRNTTTTELPPEWQEIDLSRLHKRGINFNQGHIKSLWEFLKVHSSLDFQESIEAFVYDLEHSHLKPYTGSLNMFIGVIRGGQLYSSSHYVSPAQSQINEILKRSAEFQENRFLAWVEKNHVEIFARINEHDKSLAIDFKFRGKESMEYIKNNLYLKMLKEEIV